MKLFRKKQVQGSPGKDKLAHGIVRFIQRIQMRFATFMQARTNRMSHLRLKWCFAIFILISVALSSYCILSVFGHQTHALHIDRISVPKYYEQQTEPQSDHTADYEQILLFQRFLDSLHQARPTQYDSLMKARPKLLDSLQFLEKIYSNQYKK